MFPRDPFFIKFKEVFLIVTTLIYLLSNWKTHILYIHTPHACEGNISMYFKFFEVDPRGSKFYKNLKVFSFTTRFPLGVKLTVKQKTPSTSSHCTNLGPTNPGQLL